MTAESITAYATLATVFVIGASALAALVQLRHMRAGNQLEAVLSLEADFRSDAVQSALTYVQQQLPQRLGEQRYRAELAKIGFINTEQHPELVACNWFNAMGTLLKHDLISEETFMDLFARLIRYYWKGLSPVIAIMRRTRGGGQYHDFEYLAIRADKWLNKHPQGIFPRNIGRLTLPDPWREQDQAHDAQT